MDHPAPVNLESGEPATLEDAKELIRSLRNEIRRLKKAHQLEIGKIREQGEKRTEEALGKLRRTLGKEIEGKREQRRQLQLQGVNKQEENQRNGKARHEAHESRSWPMNYLNQFLGEVRCAGDLLNTHVFRLPGAAKEVTEAMACHQAIRQYLMKDRGPFDLEDPEVAVIVIGDGSTPRAGALIAMRTKWRCYSIDPAMKTKMTVNPDGSRSFAWKEVTRLTVVPERIQDFKLAAKKAILVMMHCHVDLEEAVGCLDGVCQQFALICCSCCEFVARQGQLRGKPPLIEYNDLEMATPQNLIRIWIEGDFDPLALNP